MRPTSAIERLWACIVACAIAGGFLGIAAVHGALGIPRNDDWSYLKVTFDLAQTGQLQLTGWVQMFFIGQAVIAQPIVQLTGASIAALQILVAAMAAGTLVLTYLLIRHLLPPVLATVAVAPLAVGVMYGSLATSFMTDIPAIFLSLLTLSVGLRGILAAKPRHAVIWLVAATAMGLLAFTIREYGLLSWISVGVTAVVCGSRLVRLVSALLLAASAFIALGLWIWRSGLPGSLPTEFAINSVQTAAATLAAALLTLAIFVAPTALMVSPSALARTWREYLRTRTAKAVATASAAGLLVLLVALLARSRFPLGNYLTASGSYPGTFVGSWDLPLLPPWGLLALAGLGLAWFAIALTVAAAPRPRTGTRTSTGTSTRTKLGAPTMLIATYLGAITLLLALFALLLDQLWDRYLLPMIPFVGALLLSAAQHRGLLITRGWYAVPAVGLLAYALVGLSFVDRAAAMDGGAWAAAERAVASGTDPASIDGGFAWNGTWQPGPVAWPMEPVPWTWWRGLYPDAEFCSQVQVSQDRPQHAPALEQRTAIGTSLWFTVVETPDSARLPQC